MSDPVVAPPRENPRADPRAPLHDWERHPERSTHFALWIIEFVCFRLSRRAARLLLYPIVLYFTLFGPRIAAASRDYLARVLGRRASIADHYRHLHCYARVTVDRMFLLREGPGRFAIDPAPRNPRIHELAQQRRGALLLLAHLGSFEVLRVQGVRGQPWPIRLLMERSHTARLNQMLERLNPAMVQTVIDVSERGPELALRIKEALDAGCLVCLMADRVRGGEAAASADFLGAPARFPLSPWLLAAALRVPVLLGFGLERGDGAYETQVELYSERIELPRAGRHAAAAEHARRYAVRLEQAVRSAPYNWFNFYHFWDVERAAPGHP